VVLLHTPLVQLVEAMVSFGTMAVAVVVEPGTLLVLG
jgi:hypothetical protein